MPELPEVEARLIYLRNTALNQPIQKVIVTEPRIIKAPAPALFRRRLKGKRMTAANRRGKYLVVSLDDGWSLILHFTMGGDLVYLDSSTPSPRFTRIEFVFVSGSRLAFTCPRNICRVMLVDSVSKIPGLRDMGPEPLGSGFRASDLKALLARSRYRRIKALLLDQKSVAGIGNIYADEILYEAEIHPSRPSSTLDDGETGRLYRAIRKILRAALKTGGDEEFPVHFLISLDARDAGCARCASPIQRTRIAGRTTRFCSGCQK